MTIKRHLHEQQPTKEQIFSEIPGIRQAYRDALVAEAGQFTGARYKELSGPVLAEIVVYLGQEHDNEGTLGVCLGYGVPQADDEDVVARLTPGSLAGIMIHEADNAPKLADVTNLLLESPLRDYFERESAEDILTLRNGQMQLLNSGIQVSPSHHASIKMSDVYSKISDRFVGMISSADSDENVLTDITKLLDDFTDESRVTLARSLETSIRRFLMKVPGQHDDVIGLVSELNSKGLLRDIRETGSVISQMDLVVQNPALAEVLQANLVASSMETTRWGERTSTFLARTIMHMLLEKYAADPTRHAMNASKALSYIFPDPKRPDSLSRVNLIRLANHINGGARSYEDGQSGVAANAFADVLKITRIDGHEDRHQQEFEDNLYTNIVGMLLEQRNIAAAALRSLDSQPTN